MARPTKHDNTYLTPLTTNVTAQMRDEFSTWNAKHPGNKIAWAECMRRGFYSVLREKRGASLDEMWDDMPLAARERIAALSSKIQELANEIHKLKGA